MIIDVKTHEILIRRFCELIGKYHFVNEKLEEPFLGHRLLIETYSILDGSPYLPFDMYPSDNLFSEEISLAQAITIGINNFLFDEFGTLEVFIRQLRRVFNAIDTIKANTKTGGRLR